MAFSPENFPPVFPGQGLLLNDSLVAEEHNENKHEPIHQKTVFGQEAQRLWSDRQDDRPQHGPDEGLGAAEYDEQENFDRPINFKVMGRNEGNKMGVQGPGPSRDQGAQRKG